ncbi:MAG TPA: carboxypeptidase-like regulatory domain-containing protein [Terriglobia bacterium]|nr:carboxypeptidase-like regulatory domain-containing protein [Terriglobia bacterium]
MKIALALLLLAQAGAVTRPGIPTGIQGMIVATGDPPFALPNARVELTRVQPSQSGPNAEAPRVARADVNGRFEFSGVRPGQYRLKVTRDRYLRKEYGEVALDEPGPPITLSNGQRLDLRIVLDPAPSISGRISDEQGEGVPNALVRAYRVNYDTRGSRRITPAFSTETDDHGEYRLYWIDPGEYYVGAAIVPDPVFDNPNEVTPPDGYAPMYYPGLTDPAGVEPIRLRIGTEAAGIDFRLTRDPEFRERRVTLRGDVVMGRTNLPGRSRITLEPLGDVAALVPRDESTEADGSFEIHEVEPGDYMLVAQAVRSAGRGAGRETGFVRLLIRNQDVSGIRIVPTTGTRLEGLLTVETPAGASRNTRDLSSARIELRPVAASVPVAVGDPPRAEGDFGIDRFYTGSDYSVSVSGLPGDLYLKSARIGSVDILDAGVFHLNFQSASDLLEIALGADGGSLKGSVYAENSNRPVPGARVVLAPDPKRRNRAEQYRMIVADDVGNFVIRGIPPGAYSLFAWRRMEPNAYLNRDFLSSYEGDGSPILIQAGENKPAGLRVIPER